MMKKSTLLCLAFIMGVSGICAHAEEKKEEKAVMQEMILEYDGGVHKYKGSVYALKVNGKEVETPLEPIIFNDRALVPVREVFEATGATVDYDGKTKEIHIEGNGIKMLMQIGSEDVEINGEEKSFEDGVSPMLIAKKGESAKTMVPVRFISENLGYEVDFDGEEIDIITEERPTLSSLYLKRGGDAVMISVKADKELTEVKNPVLTDKGVLYIDFLNVESKLSGTTQIGKGAVEQIRIGIHDDYTRIALDTTDLKSYSMEMSKDKKTVMIKTLKKPEPKEEEEEEEKIVVIDAGHGGNDGGAVTELEGETIKEKDINLNVAKKTVEILKSNGVKVEMTRTGDTYPELTERAEFANGLNAAIFVSIHSNSAAAPEAKGIEVFYSTQNNDDDYGVKSQELADKILTAMINYTKANNRKVKSENHVVTRKSDMPAALVELGFITNEAELENLLDEDYQYKLASGIAEGIMKCLPKITIPDEETIEIDGTDLGDKIA